MLNHQDLALYRDPNNYRPNVGFILLNPTSRLVLVGKRRIPASPECWQFPQGGVKVHTDASLESTLRREMMEELGVSSFKILKRTNHSITYEFPAEMQRVYPSKSHLLPQIGMDSAGNQVFYRGQEQIWFLCGLDDDNSTVSLENATEDEFVGIKWITPQQALDLIFENKRASYETVLKEFGLI